MRMKKVAVAVASAGLAVAAFADVAVSNVVVQQRWPWNGKVDIDYEVFSDNPDDSVFVYPLGFENDRNIAIAPRTLTGEGVEPAMVGARVKPGKHRMTWEMDKDEPTLHSSAFTITMHAVKGGMYLVVDLSGGPNAEKYPIRYSDVPPDITDDACRTTNLWLRLCLPGTFMMGSPTDEYGRETTYAGAYSPKETLHEVVLTKPFYVGIFEFTQRQYALVMPSVPNIATSYKGDLRPMCYVSYDALRGSVSGAAWPQHSQVDPSSFFGVLRAKTGVLFDLPTEAQWEYACRAGTSTAFNDGTGATQNLYGRVCRCNNNYTSQVNGYTYTYHTVVGQYLPNAWGLYDMHGNVTEWCLDKFAANLGNARVVDPNGPTSWISTSGKFRVMRGGCAWPGYVGYWQNCRSAARHCSTFRGTSNSTSYVDQSASASAEFIGFRVVATPVVQ